MKRLLLALAAATAMAGTAQANPPTNALGEPMVEQFDPNAKPVPYGSKEQKAQDAEREKKVDRYLKEHYPNGIPHQQATSTPSQRLWFLADLDALQCIAVPDSQVAAVAELWQSQGYQPSLLPTNTGGRILAVATAYKDAYLFYETMPDCQQAIAITRRDGRGFH